jgi:hypothetical protein
MPKSKFEGKVQGRPKLVAYTLVIKTHSGIRFARVKAIDVDGARSLSDPGDAVLCILKGHPDTVG